MYSKTAVITGGSRGIGKGIALKLAKDGYNIVIANKTKKQDTIDEIRAIGAPVLFVEADISDRTSREHLVEACINEFGRIDVLVNNAGVAPKVRADLLETSEESIDFVLDINLKGTFFLTQLVASKMVGWVEEGQQENPRIINISSISAYTSSVNRPEYCLSKAGISMMTKLFADRLAEYGILVYEVRPGIIMTDMTSKVKEKYDKLIGDGLTPIKRWGYPVDVANAVSSLCGEGFLFSTGQVINVDGGFHIRRL